MSPPQKLPGWIVGTVGALGLLTAVGTQPWNLRSSSSSTKPPVQAPARALKVALVTPGALNDNGWSQGAYEGLLLLESHMGAQISFRASVAPRDAEGIIRRFAEQGYEYIIVHGAQYVPATERVANDYFRTKFAVTSIYPGNNKNFGSLAFRGGEVGYLAGAVAAMNSRSKQVAYLAGEHYPSTEESTLLFQRGARAIAPDIKVEIAWVNSWTDGARARALAEAQLKHGADVVSVDLASASAEALGAIEGAGARAIGWDYDASRVAPRAVVATVQQYVPQLLFEGAKLVLQGRWEGRQYKFGLREGAQAVVPAPGVLTPAQRQRLEALTQDIQRGKIDVSP